MNFTLPPQYDFLGRFYRAAIINVLSNITEPLAGLISVAFLAHLDQIEHLAGVTLSTTLFNYIYALFIFLRMGTTGVTAQAVGRDDREGMLLVGLRNSLIALGIGLLILILQYPIQQLWFACVSATPEVKASGVAYFNARIWGAPAIFLNVVLIGWLLGREQSQKVLLMTVVSNCANIGFDYLFITRWDWASTGAGLSQAISQYLMLLAGMILAILEIEWKEVGAAIRKLWDIEAFKAIFTLSNDIFVRSLANTTVSFIFVNLSSLMGAITLAENALLLQVLFICHFCNEGIAFAVETLGGNFKGQEAIERLLPLLRIAVGTSLIASMAFAGACVLFPESVFGLLTDHAEVIEKIKIHASWSLSLLGFSSISVILQGYFLGLAEGSALRNAALTGALLGFAPFAGLAWYHHSNHILLLAMSGSMVVNATVLGFQVPRTLNNSPETTVGASD